MREYLLTKFVCSKCGSNLRLTYDIPKGAGRCANLEPTGAAMVQQLVAIEPCHCVTAPLDEIKRAASLLFASVKGDNAGIERR